MTRDPKEKVAELNDVVAVVASVNRQLGVNEKEITAEMQALQGQIEEIVQQSEAVKKEMMNAPGQTSAIQANERAMQEAAARIQAQSQILRDQQREAKLEEWQAYAQGVVNARSGAPTNTVFRSDGAGAPALVVVTAERMLVVAIPYGINAKQYDVRTAIARSPDGKNLGESATLTHPCESGGCPNMDDYITITPSMKPPGSYTLTATVKDVASSNQKTYVVNFVVK
jgi:hypothetical protein